MSDRVSAGQVDTCDDCAKLNVAPCPHVSAGQGETPEFCGNCDRGLRWDPRVDGNVVPCQCTLTGHDKVGDEMLCEEFGHSWRGDLCVRCLTMKETPDE